MLTGRSSLSPAPLPLAARARAACPSLDSHLPLRVRFIHLPRLVLSPSSTSATFVLLRSIELHVNIEFRVDEPPFSSKQQIYVVLESACCKRLFQVFQMFLSYITGVSCGCYKRRSRCCISCNGCLHMLRVFVPNVSSIFSEVCCKFVYLDVAYVSYICLQVFYLEVAYFFQWFQVFFWYFCKCFRCIFQVFHMSSDIYCKYCI
jgi:hypothetical protein